MRYTLSLFAVVCAVLPAGEFKAQQNIVDAPIVMAKKHAGGNAASLYRQAFAAMPSLNEAERKLLDTTSATPSEVGRVLVAKAEPALELAAAASRANYCDWNLDLDEGGMLALPHLGSLRDLAKFALLKARMADARTAVEQHEMVLRMARHAASTPLLMCRLMGISIEAKGMTSIAAMLPQWDEGLCNRLRSMMTDGLDPAPSVSDCVVVEGKCMSAWYSKSLDAELKKSAASFDVRAWLEKLASGSKLDELLKQTGQPAGSLPKDAVGARRSIEDFRVQMLELARIVALPRDAMNKEAAAFEQKLRAEARPNVFIEAMRPIVMNARAAELKLENMIGLLRAAFEVQANGESALPAALATHRKTNGGFELTSKELFNGKPTVLTVGPR